MVLGSEDVPWCVDPIYPESEGQLCFLSAFGLGLAHDDDDEVKKVFGPMF